MSKNNNYDLNIDVRKLINDNEYIKPGQVGRHVKVEYQPIYEKIEKGELPVVVDVKGNTKTAKKIVIAIRAYLIRKKLLDKYVVVTRKISDEQSVIQVQERVE